MRMIEKKTTEKHETIKSSFVVSTIFSIWPININDFSASVSLLAFIAIERIRWFTKCDKQKENSNKIKCSVFIYHRPEITTIGNCFHFNIRFNRRLVRCAEMKEDLTHTHTCANATKNEADNNRNEGSRWKDRQFLFVLFRHRVYSFNRGASAHPTVSRVARTHLIWMSQSMWANHNDFSS